MYMLDSTHVQYTFTVRTCVFLACLPSHFTFQCTCMCCSSDGASERRTLVLECYIWRSTTRNNRDSVRMSGLGRVHVWYYVCEPLFTGQLTLAHVHVFTFIINCIRFIQVHVHVLTVYICLCIIIISFYRHVLYNVHAQYRVESSLFSIIHVFVVVMSKAAS